MFATRFKRVSAFSFALLALASLMNPAFADRDRDDDDKIASIEIFAPEKGYVAGLGSRAFLVDLAIEFEGNLASTGVTPELTGPGPLANAGPFPGTFGFGANTDHFPGLVVLLSSTVSGPGRNLANLFNITTVTNQEEDSTEIWTTWIVGAPNAFGKAGEDTPSRLFVAVVEGVAPDAVTDMDGNGVFDKKDLKLMGYKVISNTPKVDFVVNGF
ncbi:MAG TPA: hypothetical protein VN283_01580 [Thiobacillus sp.]|nr:hypothetical protein [Thiobacillus sp.]